MASLRMCAQADLLSVLSEISGLRKSEDALERWEHQAQAKNRL